MAGDNMSEVFASRPQPVPAALPPLLSFAAGFIDSFTVLALFGMFVAQVTGSFVLQQRPSSPRNRARVTKVLAIPVFLLAAVVTTVLAVHARAPRPRGPSRLGAGTGMPGADRVSGRRFCLSAHRWLDPNAVCGGDREPARPVRHGHAERDGAAADEERGIDQCDDDEHDADRHRRQPNWCSPGRPIAVRPPMPPRRRPRRWLPRACGSPALFPIMLGFLLGTATGTIAYVGIGTWGLLLPVAINVRRLRLGECVARRPADAGALNASPRRCCRRRRW